MAQNKEILTSWNLDGIISVKVIHLKVICTYYKEKNSLQFVLHARNGLTLYVVASP